MAVYVEVWGEYACFSRPEMKVERVSYDVMTPSAARGLLEAIYWHPCFRWIIDKIYVLSPIRFTSIRRNEVDNTISMRVASRAMETGKNVYLATTESIVQRASLVLRDVHYVIEAHFEMTQRASVNDNPGKILDIMRRRLEKGQFYHQPCFGVREFPAFFRACAKNAFSHCPDELKGNKDLGWMLLDMDYTNHNDIVPLFFRAELIDGVLTVPRLENTEVFR